MTARAVKSVLSVDEQIAVFLTKWESVRVGLAEKHRLRAEQYRPRTDMRICYDVARRAQRHYEYELSMLRELRARAL